MQCLLSVEIYKQLLSSSSKSPVSSTCFLVIKYEQVHCSNGLREFDSHTTTKKYINMTRNELKNLWFSIPRQVNKKEVKVIVVDINGGFYKITTDVEGYYSSSTQGGYGDNVLNVVLDRIKVNDGVNDLSKYQLIIK